MTEEEAQEIRRQALATTGNREARRAHLQALPDPAPLPPLALFCGRAARQLIVRHGADVVVNKIEHGLFWTCECGARGDTYNPQVLEAVVKKGDPVPTQCPNCKRSIILKESRVSVVSDGVATGMIRSLLKSKKA